MKKRGQIQILAACVMSPLILRISQTACAATSATWLGGTGNWATKASWSPATIPNNGSPASAVYDVAIDGGKTAVNSSVSVTSKITINSLSVDSGDSLAVASGGTLTISTLSNAGTVTASAGGQVVATALVNNLPITGSLVADGGSIKINGSETLANSLSLVIANGGTVSCGTLNTSGNVLSVPGGCAITASTLINNSGVLQCSGNVSTATLNNSGAFNLSGTAIFSCSYGTINNSGGTISTSGSSICNIVNTALNGGTLSSSGGTSFNSSSGSFSNVTNNGVINFNGYSNSLSGQITNNGQMNFNGGYLGIPTGNLILSGTGKYHLQGVSASAQTSTLPHNIINQSTIDGFGTIFYGIGGGIPETIQNDGLIEGTSSTSLVLVGDQINNESDGSMIVTAGARMDVRSPQFISSGTITIQPGGIFQIGGGANGSSTYVSTVGAISNGGSLNILQDIASIASISGGDFTPNYFSTVTVGALIGMNSITIGGFGPAALLIKPQISSQVSPKLTPVSSAQALIIPQGTLDLANNSFLINYGQATDPKASIVAYLSAGSNNGAWNGWSGIISSTASAQPFSRHYGIGFADASDGLDPSLSMGQLEIAYTLYGDITLQGVVNETDLNLFAQYYGQAVTGGWSQGDFLGTGHVTESDFALLAANFGLNADGSSANLPASEYQALNAFAVANGLQSDVPEPVATGWLAIAALPGSIRLLRRRAIT